MTRVSPVLRCVLGAAILLFAGVVLSRQLQSLTIEQLRAAWSSTPPLAICASGLGTAISFACLAWYERFATQQVVPGRVPTAMALRVGASSHAISNTLGFHALTGSAFRYRAYRNLGLSAIDVGRVVVRVGVCVAIGVIVVSGMALLWSQLATGGFRLPLLGALAVLLGVVLVHRAGWLRSMRRSIAWRNVGWLSLLGVIEMIATVGALYVLMPVTTTLTFAAFVLLFVTAMLVGIISHAPGGIGVFEASILTAMPRDSHAQVLIALLTYRVIYNLLPFALAIVALLRQRLRRPVAVITDTSV